jgi:hypothetical protein
MTLTEFLLARIAEDQERAIAAGGATAWRSRGPDGSEAAIVSVTGERLVYVDMEDMVRLDRSTLALAAHLAEWLPGRVLADCDAKRQIVELHAENSTIPGREVLPCWRCDEDYPCTTVRLLALPYADHADFHRGWKP